MTEAMAAVIHMLFRETAQVQIKNVIDPEAHNKLLISGKGSKMLTECESSSITTYLVVVPDTQ